MTPEKLYEENERLVYYTVSRYFPELLGNDDVLQEARIALWKCCCVYDPKKGKLSTLACKAIYRAVLCWLRAEKSYRGGMTIVSLQDEAPGTDHATLEDCLPGAPDVGWHDWDKLREILTDREREVLMRFARGESTEEITSALGLSRMTIYKALKTARRKAGRIL